MGRRLNYQTKNKITKNQNNDQRRKVRNRGSDGKLLYKLDADSQYERLAQREKANLLLELQLRAGNENKFDRAVRGVNSKTYPYINKCISQATTRIGILL